MCVGAKEKPRNMMGYNRASFKLLFPLKKLASPKYDSSPYSKNQRNEIFQIAGFLPKKKVTVFQVTKNHFLVIRPTPRT